MNDSNDEELDRKTGMLYRGGSHDARNSVGDSLDNSAQTDPVFSLSRIHELSLSRGHTSLGWAINTAEISRLPRQRASSLPPSQHVFPTIEEGVKITGLGAEIEFTKVVVWKQVYEPVRPAVQFGGCLRQFLALPKQHEGSSRTSDDDVLMFVSRWGLLNHHDGLNGSTAAQVHDGYASSQAICEPIEVYRWMSGWMRSILSLAAALQRNDESDLRDWEVLLQAMPLIMRYKDRRSGYAAPSYRDVDIQGFKDAWSSAEPRVRRSEEESVLLALLSNILTAYGDTLFPYARLYGTSGDKQFIKSEGVKEDARTWTGMTHSILRSLYPIPTGIDQSTSRLESGLVMDMLGWICSPAGIYRCAWCGQPFAPRKNQQNPSGKRYCPPPDNQSILDCRTLAKNARQKVFDQRKAAGRKGTPTE